LIHALHEHGHIVHALVRRGSESRLPADARSVRGDALDAGSFASAIPAGATVVHLVGTPHPNPAKAAQFRSPATGVRIVEVPEIRRARSF
jgi:uncharacterized protein YbjT (DUF2867 family)